MRIHLSVLLLVLVPMATAEACVDKAEVEDPEGDVVVWPAVPADGLFSTGPLDLVRHALRIEQDELVVSTTLVEAPPRDAPLEHYRYWHGFQVRGGGEDHTLDLRMHHTGTYESATLVGPGATDPEDMGEFAAHWDGNTVSFRVPLPILEDLFPEEPLQVGGPYASSDGPHRSDGPQGPGAAVPYMVDTTGPPDFPAVLCTGPDEPTPSTPAGNDGTSTGTDGAPAGNNGAPAGNDGAAAGTQATPVPVWASMLALAAALTRRR